MQSTLNYYKAPNRHHEERLVPIEENASLHPATKYLYSKFRMTVFVWLMLFCLSLHISPSMSHFSLLSLSLRKKNKKKTKQKKKLSRWFALSQTLPPQKDQSGITRTFRVLPACRYCQTGCGKREKVSFDKTLVGSGFNNLQL